MKLGMISLGCAKNLIDTELFLGVARKYQIEITNNLKDADIIVVNTCGFIENAKKEAIDTLLDVCENKKHRTIIAMGCLVERYLDDLKKNIPEVDIYFPIRDYQNIDELFNKITKKNNHYKMDYCERLVTTYPHSAYLRISEGCNNRCSYCAIPLIRGPFKSRPFDDIVKEAMVLVNKGVKEITLIGQDTSRYGCDLSHNESLASLLKALVKIKSLEILRVLYLYPDEITDELILTIKDEPKIANYFDIPLQHASNKILKAMNRRQDRSYIKSLIKKIRDLIPDAIIRTTMLVGFPSENSNDFKILKDFIKKIKFNRLGVFTYSDEENTKGYEMKPKVKQQTMEKRSNEIMMIQQQISYEYNQSLIGKKYQAIVDEYDEKHHHYIVRTYAFAPDDVDGYIYIDDTYHQELIGTIQTIEIITAFVYDLKAKFIF